MKARLAIVALLFASPLLFSKEESDIKHILRLGGRFEESAENNPVRLSVESRILADIDLGVIAKFGDLEQVTIRHSRITDKGIASFGKLKKLRYLVLRDNLNLMGTGFVHLKENRCLENLVLSGCSITDDGLNSIACLDSLKNLNLSRTQVTDRGLVCLKKLDQLQSLWLNDTRIGTQGIRNLKGSLNINALFLSKTLIDDDSIKVISGLEKLAWLNLSQTKVSDRSVKEISRLKLLFIIDIRQTQITSQGVIELRRAFPKAVIHSDEDPD